MRNFKRPGSVGRIEREEQAAVADERADDQVDSDAMRVLVDLWGKAVDAQVQFARIGSRSRRFGLALVIGALLLAALLLGAGERWSIVLAIGSRPFALHTAVLVLAVAVIGLVLVRLDLQASERMYRGAASFAEDLEERWLRKELGVAKGLTQAVGHFQRFSDARSEVEDKRVRYVGHLPAGESLRGLPAAVVALPALAGLLILVTSNLGAKPAVAEEAAPVPVAVEAPRPEPVRVQPTPPPLAPASLAVARGGKAKAAEAKPAEEKPAEAKVEAKPAEAAKPVEAKPVEPPKPVAEPPKPKVEAKPEPKAEAKPKAEEEEAEE